MEKVVIKKCNSYEVDLIEKTLRDGFQLLGGEQYLRKLIPENSKVLLKPNLLCVESKGALPVTDYRMFEAVIRVIQDYAGEIVYGDSPGFGTFEKAAEASGIAEVAKKYNVKAADFMDWTTVKLDNPLLCPTFDVAKAVLKADVIISLPRIKTHAMAFYTGAIKNQFGCVSGFKKAAWHARMPKVRDFSRMLLDLNTLVGAKFAILDGIVAMEGNGPKNGNPKELGAILMGSSLSALDTVAASVIGYDPLDVPYLKEAKEAAWGVTDLEEIEILGESMDDVRPDSFELCRASNNFTFKDDSYLDRIFERLVSPSPKLKIEKCISCQRCIKMCPERPKVLHMVEKKGKQVPEWEMKYCIKCFCCQEICPAGAIEAKYPFLAELLGMGRKKKKSN